MKYAYICLLAAFMLAGCDDSTNRFIDYCHSRHGVFHAADWSGSDAWCDFGDGK